jgi:hypothetical protein
VTDYIWWKLASLAVVLVSIGVLARYDPKGARHAWLGFGRDAALAIAFGVVWAAGLLGTAAVARDVWGVPPLRSMLVYAGASHAAAALSNADWFWNWNSTKRLVQAFGKRTIRVLFVAVSLAVVAVGVLGRGSAFAP